MFDFLKKKKEEKELQEALKKEETKNYQNILEIKSIQANINNDNIANKLDKIIDNLTMSNPTSCSDGLKAIDLLIETILGILKAGILNCNDCQPFSEDILNKYISLLDELSIERANPSPKFFYKEYTSLFAKLLNAYSYLDLTNKQIDFFNNERTKLKKDYQKCVLNNNESEKNEILHKTVDIKNKVDHLTLEKEKKETVITNLENQLNAYK